MKYKNQSFLAQSTNYPQKQTYDFTSEYQFIVTPTFGQVIRTARTSIGCSQRELAALVEVDFTYLSKLESDSAERTLA